jgi:hypothetical protein
MCLRYNSSPELQKSRQILRQHLANTVRKNSIDDFDFLVTVELGIFNEIDEYSIEIQDLLDQYYEQEEKDNEWLLLALAGVMRSIYLSVGEYVDRRYSNHYDVEQNPMFELLLLPFITQRNSQILNTIVSNASQRSGEQTLARAITIASTEVRVAQSIAERLVMERVDRQKPLVKYWVGTLDDRIRQDHFDAASFYNQNNAIGFNETFLVGGEWMRYPRDTMASAKNVVNCRCYLSYRQL